MKGKSDTKARSKMYNHEEGVKVSKGPAFKASLGAGKTSPCLHIMSWNVNGIRNIISRQHMNRFIYKFTPDIFCINQTKIDADSWSRNPISIHGYCGYWSFCRVSSGYSGVAIFCKNLPISVFEDLEEPQYSQQGRVLTLQFEYFYLIAVYVPSAGQKLDRLDYKINKFEVAFHRHCNRYKERARQQGKAIIVCGDLNTAHENKDAHVARWTHKTPGFTDSERRSLRNFLNSGWIDTYRKLNPQGRKYSWWHLQLNGRQNRVGKRLDYFLVDPDTINCVTQADVYEDFLGSDHSPVGIKIDLRDIIEREAHRKSIEHFKKGQMNSKVEEQLQKACKEDEIEKKEELPEGDENTVGEGSNKEQGSKADRVALKAVGELPAVS